MNFIEDLIEESESIVKALKSNRLKGIYKLLTELYPDNAHFIYELLQNAEDAKATKLEFHLDFNGLTCKHNGKRQFNEKDIESILSVGDSNKRDDPTQIGQFGVGFKAVFSYTTTPKVYSGEWAFEIHDLVCPRLIPQILQGDDNSTLFYFPFNNDKKPNTVAFQEIRKTILNLPDNTVLFLQHIEEIRWELFDTTKEFGFIKRSPIKETTENHFQIEKQTDELQKTHWLRFIKEFPIRDDKNSFVSIAFRLKKLNEQNEFVIDKEVKKGDVSIFFPAENEHSGFRFFIHAPFASTVARDSIRNCDQNEVLRDLLSNLLIESVSKIKEFGMLDFNFLEILPNNKDELADFYKPFLEQVLELFKSQNYTPTINGSFLPAKKLIQANNEIKRTINKNTILFHLTEREDVDWSIDAQTGSRLFDFLESLEIKEWGWKELLFIVGDKFKQEEFANEALSQQTDEWMQQFYILLGKAKAEVRYVSWDFPKIENTYIVRLENRVHSIGENVYFQTELVKNAKDILIAEPKIYQSDNDVNQNEKSKSFLKVVGVEDFEPRDEIKIILERHYIEGRKVTEKENIKHIKKFIKFWREYPKEKTIFFKYKILRTTNSKYLVPSEIFVDNPYEKTRLTLVKSFINKQRLWSGYSTQIKNQKDLVAFLKEIGVVSKLEILPAYVYGNVSSTDLRQDAIRGARVTDYELNEDYKINNLESILKEKNREISKLIWETISKADRKVLQAKYRPSKTFVPRVNLSQLVHTLKQITWILDKEGNFHKPEDITREMLPDDFPFDNRNGWLDAIGIGKQAQKTKIDEQKQVENAAKQLGFKSLEEAKKAIEWLKLSDEERAEFEDFKRSKRSEKQQKSDSSDNSNESESSRTETNGESKKAKENQGINNTEADKENKPRQNNQSATPPTHSSADEIEYLVKSRPYQRDFKNRLKNLENKCRVTGITSMEFLIASHIKPVRDCTDAEKVDENNGFLMSPHVDRLFDKGWISFADDGNILCTYEFVKEVMKVWRLDINKPVGAFNEMQKEYLAYHRKKFGFEI
jgi:HNH endonuclease